MRDSNSILGMMDTDSPDHMIAPGFHKMARNLIFKGVRGRLRAEGVAGTTAIVNPNMPALGVNLCLGCFYDPVNQQLYDFNFNSLGTSGIYVYGTVSGIWQTIIQVGTNTIGDPLGFLATPRIQGVAMIYGDSTDGNLLFFLNSSGVPTKINVTRFLNTPYTNIVRPYLEVIKAPPIVPPRIVYENDTSVNANNLTNSLFQFAYTWLYDDHEESVISSGSITPLPIFPFSNTKNTDKTLASRISLYMRTGDQNVVKIRIYMRQTQNGVTSGWFIVDTISKAGNSISDNSVYRYVFYNSGNFIPADPSFTPLLYDFVPPKANCQELLNGDTLSYAGITEGYTWFKSQFSTNLTFNSNEDVDYILNGVLFFADYNGVFVGNQPVVQIVLTGSGINDVSSNPKVLTQFPENLYVNASSSGTDVSFNILNVTSDIPTILAALSAAAVSAGWSVASAPTSNSIFIYYPTGTFLLKSTRIENRALDVNNISYQLALYPESNYSYGVVYYDQYGRTNGVITDVSANISTLPYNTASDTTITNVQLNLNGIIPPAWAVYYHVVRTNSLTYNKHLYWVSNQAFSNIGQLIDNQYAYIGITNIADYNLAIQATQGVVGYQFTQGDRIRFVGRYTFSGTFTPLTFDYQILGVDVNPIINGQEQLGSFIKIAYPTADIGPNFKFNSSTDTSSVDFNDYFILIYSVASNASPSKGNAGSGSSLGNVYYEFGQQYFIGNPGLNTAFHFGNLADNQVIFNDGDIFARQRTIPAGATNYLFCASNPGFSNRYITPAIAASPSPIIVTPYYTINQQPPGHSADAFNPAVYPTFGDVGGLFTNQTANTINIRLRGTVPVTVTGQSWMDIVCKILGPAGQILNPVIVVHSDPVDTSAGINIEFDGTVAVPAGYKLWLIFGNGEMVHNLLYNGFLLRMDIVNNITIDIFEPSFSDVFNLITNSNSRAIVQDTTAKKTYFSTLFRFSRNYQVGTTINNTNRFYPNDFDEFDKSHGDVMRMRARQKELRVFQKRRCGRVGIYAKFVKNNDGAINLIVSDTIITQNNIQYYEGEYGIGNQPDSLSSSGFADYFADDVKGAFLRLSVNGIENITHELTQGSKVQVFAGENLPNYLNQYAYQFGGNAVVLGAYNFTEDRDSEAIFVLQGGTGALGTIPGQSIAFVEAGNRWTSVYDFAPDAMVCCENQLYSFSNGKLFIHNNQSAYCNFYGTQYTPSITIVKNSNPEVGKTFMSIEEISNVVWNSPLVYTDMNTYGIQRQESKLFDQYFKLLEAKYCCNFFRDLHSRGGIGNGNAMKGQLIVIQLQPTDGSKFSWLADVSIKFILSPALVK